MSPMEHLITGPCSKCTMHGGVLTKFQELQPDRGVLLQDLVCQVYMDRIVQYSSDLQGIPQLTACWTLGVTCGTPSSGGTEHRAAPALFLTPWRIGTLKYLEIKIEEWPNRAKWGQSGPNGAKWCQMMPNRVKRVQTGSNGLKRGQKGPYGAKLGQKGQTGQTKPNGVKWG